MSEKPTGEGIGQALPRQEDLRLLRGRGRYAADVVMPNMVFAAMVRSPHAHARIQRIDASAAKQAPGVVAIFTGADWVADGRKPIPHAASYIGPPDVDLTLKPDYKVYHARHLPMPDKTVQYVGEPVAIVIAETLDQAHDAAELVEVDYEVLPAIVRAADAVKPGAASVWDDRRDNIAIDAEVGDKAKTDAAFAVAKHVVKFETWINRVTGTPMEPRAALGFIDEKKRYTIWAGTGGGMVRERQTLAGALGVSPEECRAMCGDMGGNFGTRNTFFAEYALLPWAAKKLGRPVKFLADRSECFLTDYEGRDLTSIQDRHAVAQPVGLFHVVRGQEDGRPGPSQLRNAVAKVTRHAGVEPAGGFIEEEHARPVEQGSGDQQALLHAVGVVLEPILGPIGQTDELQDHPDAPPVDTIQAGGEE